jgi:UPF0716 family protein affecting phage T7 exclusion
MKAVLVKSLVVLAVVALALPFVAAALLIGASAASNVGGGGERLLLAALAIGGALLGRTRGLKRDEASEAEGKAARESSWAAGEAGHFAGLRGR